MKTSSWLLCAIALLMVAQRAAADVLVLRTSGGDVAKRYPPGKKIEQGKITLLRGQWISVIDKGKVVRINGPIPVAVPPVRATEPSLFARLAAAIRELNERPVRYGVMRSGPGEAPSDELINLGVGTGIKLRVELAAPGNPATVAGSAVRWLGSMPAQAIELVGPDKLADIVVRAGSDRIWIAGGEVPASHFNPDDRRQPPSVQCTVSDSACEQQTREAIALLARGRLISRVLASSVSGAVLQHMRVETFLRAAASGDNARDCPAFSAPKFDAGEAYRPYQPEPATASGLPVGDCDQLWVRVTNTGRLALDVTPLYFAVDGVISVMGGATGGDADLRLMPNESNEFFVRVRTMSSSGGRSFPIGAESVALIAVEQPVSAPLRTYTWLATPNQATMRSGSIDPAAAESLGEPRGDTRVDDNISTVVIMPLDVQER